MSAAPAPETEAGQAKPTSQSVDPCEHLRLARRDVRPADDSCARCRAAGTDWVRLRLCLACGNVGCCEDSAGKHAFAHFEETGHPVIQSFESGEDWVWCYLDQVSAGERDRALSVETLCRLELFQELSTEDMEALLGAARTVFFRRGEVLFRQGDPGEALYVVLDGEIEVTAHGAGGEVRLALRKPGDFVGEMALLEGAPRNGTVTALRDSRLLEIKETDFFTVLGHSPSATRAVVRAQSGRLRSTLDQLQAQQKLALLGQVAAGLIHDLNNPSAAIQRSTSLLSDAIANLSNAALELASTGATAQQVREVEALVGAPEAPTAPSDPLEVAEREDEVQDWLQDHDVPTPWEVAPPLVQQGWDASRLDRLSELIPAESVPAAARWLAARATAAGLMGELSTGAKAISEVVRAVKDYSYLDQAPVQDVDLRRSIENVLVLLKHKLGSGVQVVRDYGEDVPAVEAHGSQLSQVWMNIIDNALDALDGSGEVRIRTALEGEEVLVEICDNGPGIPPEVQGRVFEPFFTTKPQGVGSGQGLRTAHDVVVTRHRGRIDVRSRPGETCFSIHLPRRMAHG